MEQFCCCKYGHSSIAARFSRFICDRHQTFRCSSNLFCIPLVCLSRLYSFFFTGLRPRKVGDVKMVSPISIFVLNTLTLKKGAF